jgi:hypothetical protein
MQAANPAYTDGSVQLWQGKEKQGEAGGAMERVGLTRRVLCEVPNCSTVATWVKTTIWERGWNEVLLCEKHRGYMNRPLRQPFALRLETIEEWKKRIALGLYWQLQKGGQIVLGRDERLWSE